MDTNNHQSLQSLGALHFDVFPFIPRLSVSALASSVSLCFSVMEALRPSGSVSSPNPGLSISRSRLASFGRTQSGFASGICARPFGWDCFGERARRVISRRVGKQGVRCTAEGIERELLFVGRGGAGGGVEAAAENIIGAVPERFKVVALMACAMCLCNANRVVISVAVIPLAARHGWSEIWVMNGKTSK